MAFSSVIQEGKGMDAFAAAGALVAAEAAKHPTLLTVWAAWATFCVAEAQAHLPVAGGA